MQRHLLTLDRSQFSESCPDGESYDVSSPAHDAYTRSAEAAYDEPYITGQAPLTPPYTISSKNSYEPALSIPELEIRLSSKRPRSESPERTLSSTHYQRDQSKGAVTPAFPARGDSGLHRYESVLDAEPDVYQFDPHGTQALLRLYFEFHDIDLTCVLPRETIWRWLHTTSQRTHDERVVLYAMLALGSLYTTDAVLMHVGSRYAALASQAEKEVASRLSLPLALARLHLAFYHFASGNREVSCYYIHSAFRTITALQLNVHEGILNFPNNVARHELGLNGVEMIECRRRVFWLGYLTEVSCPNHIDCFY